MSRLSTESITTLSIRRPWLTVAAWGLTFLGSIVIVALFLGDALTTNDYFTNEPESVKANVLINEGFGSPGEVTFTEALVIRSDTLTLDAPQFQEFASSVATGVRGLETGTVDSVITYYETGSEALNTADRRATTAIVALPNMDSLRAYLAFIAEYEDQDDFTVRSIGVPRGSTSDVVIVRSATKTVDDPEFRAFVEDLYLDIVGLGRNIVRQGTLYYQAGDESLVSPDRDTTIIPISLNGDSAVDDVLEVIHAARADGIFEVAMTGSITLDKDFLETAANDLNVELKIGLPTALVILIIVFGALVAASLPVVLAFISIIVALAATALIGQAFQFSFFVTNMIFMIGLAVGIDYSLFIVSRFREERRRGLEKDAAITKAGSTASQAVLFSGITVILALLGMLIMPQTLFRSLAGGAILVVIAAVLASLTLLPAMLSLLGDKVNALRIPFIGRRQTAEVGDAASRNIWELVTRAVMRRPVISLIVTAGLLMAVGLPTFGLNVGFPGVSTLPNDLAAKEGFLLLEEEFSFGLVEPVRIAVSGDIQSAPVQAALDDLAASLASDNSFTGEPTIRVNTSEDLAYITVPVAGDTYSDDTVEAIRRLRSDYIPEAFDGVSAEAFVAGETANSIDFFDMSTGYLPLVFAFVLGLSFILLTLVFRSIVVPIKAIIMNLLSVGAAYGLLVLVFQEGYGASLLGFQQVQNVAAWIPLFLFSVLFGLSMDYHVFLLSRIRERFDETDDNRGSVAYGVRTTAGIITGAALIMVAVFSGFAAGDLVMFQQVGFGLAIAVLLDATIIRIILVPASMRLLGRWNWYLPKWLGWLPQIRVEGAR